MEEIVRQFNVNGEPTWLDFPHYFYHWINRLMIVAKEIIKNEKPNKMEEFLRNMREHVFIVCKLPHWGPHDDAYKGKLTKDDYKHQRKSGHNLNLE